MEKSFGIPGVHRLDVLVDRSGVVNLIQYDTDEQVEMAIVSFPKELWPMLVKEVSLAMLVARKRDREEADL